MSEFMQTNEEVEKFLSGKFPYEELSPSARSRVDEAIQAKGFYMSNEPILMNREAIRCFATALNGDIYWDKWSGDMACTVKYIKDGRVIRSEFLATEDGLYELTNTSMN